MTGLRMVLMTSALIGAASYATGANAFVHFSKDPGTFTIIAGHTISFELTENILTSDPDGDGDNLGYVFSNNSTELGVSVIEVDVTNPSPVRAAADDRLDWGATAAGSGCGLLGNKSGFCFTELSGNPIGSGETQFFDGTTNLGPASTVFVKYTLPNGATNVVSGPAGTPFGTPEPASLTLLGAGVAALGLRRRGKR